MKEELSTRLKSSETAEIMREKDEQIKGLLEEGEWSVGYRAWYGG